MTIDKICLKSALEELASREQQERVWLGLEPGVMSSFVEMACFIFSYPLLGAAMDSGDLRKWYGKSVNEKAEKLRKLVRAFPPDLSPLDEINHPMMNEIRLVAQALLNSALFWEDAPPR